MREHTCKGALPGRSLVDGPVRQLLPGRHAPPALTPPGAQGVSPGALGTQVEGSVGVVGGGGQSLYHSQSPVSPD